MAMRVSGINSGLDTDAIVQELVSAYSKKTEKYEKEQTKLGWKQDMWKSLNAKVYSLYSKISNMRYSSAYAIKTVNSSDTTKATVSANGNAVNGTHKLNVLKTAQSAYLTGGKITSAGTKVTSETTLKDLGITENTYLRVKTVGENGDWENHDIKFNGDSTIEDVKKQLQDAGLNASFDENQGRFYISSKGSGAKSDFQVAVADTKNVPMMDDDGNFIRDKDTNDVLYTEVEASGKDIVESNRLLAALGLADTTAKAGGEITAPPKSDGSPSTTVISAKSVMANLGYEKDWGPTTISVKKGDDDPVEINIDWNTSIEEVLNQLKDGGVNARFDEDTHKLVFYDKNLSFSADGSESSTKALGMLGLDGGFENFEDVAGTSFTKMNGQDAMIVLDGVFYTNSSNDFSINGLNITAQGVTNPEVDTSAPNFDPNKLTQLDNAVSITTNTDSQGLYDTIKNFLTEYNNIINEITKLYNADSSRGYDPLTDEEKDAMSDTEISKWETKIKDSLLRRDNSLNSIMSAMINSMNTGITIGDKTYSLSTFGIHTMGYLNAVENEQNAFHIDGDSEDENTSGNKDYLMAAIKEDPDTVIEFMKQLSTNLYNAIDKQMQGNSLRSRFKIYNDKELDNQYKSYTTTIKEWEKKVSAKEDYYYKKFSQMETALAKLNSQQSSLSGLLGN